MATMSAALIRSLYRRHTQAYEAVYQFSANSVGIPSPGSRQPEPPKPRQCYPPTSASAPPSAARWQKPEWPDLFRATSQLQLQETTLCRADLMDRSNP